MPRGSSKRRKEERDDKISISLNATALIFNPDGTELLLVDNKNHDKWMPPGGHVYMDKGEIPHEVVLRKVRKETGFSCRLNPDFHEEPHVYAHLPGGQKIERVPEPYCVLYEQQVEFLECGCHWHYDLYYVVKVEEDTPRKRAEFTTRWMSLGDIQNLEKKGRVYTDFVRLAEEIFKDFRDRNG